MRQNLAVLVDRDGRFQIPAASGVDQCVQVLHRSAVVDERSEDARANVGRANAAAAAEDILVVDVARIASAAGPSSGRRSVTRPSEYRNDVAQALASHIRARCRQLLTVLR